MANQIGLGVQFTASASGMTKGLSEVDRALKSLGTQASQAARLFDDFTSSSAAAAKAQQQVATDLGFLTSAFRTGQIGPEEYAKQLKLITTEANAAAKGFADGVRLTEQFTTAEEERAANLARLNQLIEAGAVSEQIAARARAEYTGQNAELAKVSAARAAAEARAAAITERNLSPIKKFQRDLTDLVALKKQDLITTEVYNAELQNLRNTYNSAATSAGKFAGSVGQQGLKFNELTGALAVLPGSLGNIAGRLSGFASAGEGLSRVFGGGLTKGFASLAESAVGIINPFTLGAAALAGLGAAAVKVGSNLVALSEKIDSLTFEAERAGVSFEFVQVLDDAARRSGVSVEALGAGLQKFAATVNEARTGSGKAAEAFARLGISQEQLASADIATTAQLTSQALSQISDPAERAALQMATLGKAGEDLRRGFSSIPEAESALQRFAGTVDQIDAGRVRDFGRSFNDLKTAFSSVATNFTTPFAGLASGITQATAEIIGSFGRLGGAILDLARPFLDGIGLIIDIFGRGVASVFNFISSFIEPLAAGFKRVSKVIQDAGAALDKITFGAASKVGEFFQGDQKATADIAKLSAQQIEQVQQAAEGGRQALERSIETAGEFGQAGFNAASRFQQGLEDLDEQVANNELNAEQYKRGVENLKKAFEAEIAAAKAAAKAEEERQRAIERAIEADRKAADAAIERVRIDQEFGGDKERFDAAQTLEAINREILRVQQAIDKARADGDQAAVDALAKRLAQLDQAAARERDIASGAAKALEERQKLEKQYAEERLRFDERRLAALARPSTELLQLEDTRTASGYAALQRFSQDQSDDPALEEYRKQLKELQAIRRKIAEVGQAADTVDILGG